MLTDTTFLHLISADSANGFLRIVLGMLGRDEEIISFEDPHHVGPLTDVDGDGTLRLDWWTRIGAAFMVDQRYDERALWEGLRRDPRPIVVWHSNGPWERLLALRVCSQLESCAERLLEVRLTPRLHSRPTYFSGAIGIQGPDVAVKGWADLAPIQDVSERAREWERIRAKPGDWVRELDQNGFIDHPVDAYDSEMVAACAVGKWTRSKIPLGMVLGENAVTLNLLIWRLRLLIERGVLEARGALNDVGLPEEIRATAVPQSKR